MAESSAESGFMHPHPSQLSATLHTVAIAVQRLKKRGLPASALLHNTGITEAMLQQPAELITRAQELTVFANARSVTGDESLGLEIGSAMHLPSYGLLGYAMLVSPTLLHSLQCALRFPMLLGSYFQLRLELDKEVAWVVVSGYHYRADLTMFNTDMCLASLWALVCDVLGNRRAPLRVELAYPAPAHEKAYAQLLGCSPVFGSSRNAFGFPGEWLDGPLQFAEPVSCHMAMRQCVQLEREWSRAAGDGLIARVQRLLYADPRRYASLDSVADALCLSGRTLRRRLLLAHTSFQALRDQALHEQACEYLQNTQLPIAAISDRLGFSDPAGFRQAFKRWTGTGPSTARKNPMASSTQNLA